MNVNRNLKRKFHLIVRLFTFESQYLNKSVGLVELNIIIRWPTSLKTLKCAGFFFYWTHGKATGFYWKVVSGILDFHSTGAFCLRVRDFEISYERIRWPAISRNQNNGGLRGEKFRVRVVICVVYLPCLRCRRCQKIEKRLGCLWQKVTAKYFRIIRGNQVVLVWNSHVVSNLAKVA